jgi:hypothetical protein
LNSGPEEYEAGVLTTQSRYSVGSNPWKLKYKKVEEKYNGNYYNEGDDVTNNNSNNNNNKRLLNT